VGDSIISTSVQQEGTAHTDRFVCHAELESPGRS
jgi:hypothetical protein